MLVQFAQRLTLHLFAASVFVVGSSFATAADVTLYVSPQGRAGWSGTLKAPNAAKTDGPLSSLEQARDKVRQLLQDPKHGSIKVLVRSGAYSLAQTLVFTPADSGSPQRPVVYAAYPGESPVVSGGRAIRGWIKGENDVWTAQVSAIQQGRWYPRQLFVNGKRARRGRLPDRGFFHISGAPVQPAPFRMKVQAGQLRPEWVSNPDVDVVVLMKWISLRMPIAAFDPASQTVTLNGTAHPESLEPGARFYIENAPSSLSEPGDWTVSRKTGVISYRARPGEDPNREQTMAPVLTQLVRLEGIPEQNKPVANLEFQGLDFSYSDWAMPAQGYADMQAAVDVPAVFQAEGAVNCQIDRCKFDHSGNYAVWFGRGCSRNRITGNRISDMGGGGIKIGESVMRPNKLEQTSQNSVTGNEISNVGLVYPSAVGVWLGQTAGNLVSRNHIHDLFYSAISVGWTWGYGPTLASGNRIEYNNLHDIGKGMLSDMGAVYTLGVQPGTVIRNNLIHDVSAYSYGGWGIYLDGGSSSILAENNVVFRCESAGLHQGYGRENIIRNNIFALNTQNQIMLSRPEPHLSFTFERNIVYFDSGSLLGAAGWTGQFAMDHNLYFNTRSRTFDFAGKPFAQWRQGGHDVHSKIADPLFVDPAHGNFKLKPDSPASSIAFTPIP